ncbi:short chain dehydrogenase reductase family [Zalerion maritima]|uniref:Short chain dehydrogenase reductase family n=1 Tax=Zalerion maritima TaxID=339359 RepID=A0AAD5WNR3_9PEZI|nr:short chain dehydrogenase reductase family [Zalerion maritima]
MFEYHTEENPVHRGVAKTDVGDELDAPELCGQFAVWFASPEAKFRKRKLVWANRDAKELLDDAESL